MMVTSALAQESLSNASLSKPPQQKEGILGKLSSLGRARQPANHVSPPASPMLSPLRSPVTPPFAPRSQPDKRNNSNEYAPSSDGSQGSVHHPTTSSQEAPVHPYANPDLIVTDEPTRDPNFSNGYSHTPARNDSSVTVTQAFANEQTSRTSMGSLAPPLPGQRRRLNSIQGKGISSPVSIQGTSLPPELGIGPEPPGTANLPGWTEKFAPPGFNLISLEEARAQRARQATVENTAGSRQPPQDDSLNDSTGPSGRTRGRTISTGAKAKNAFHSMVGSVVNERRESEPVLPPAAGNGVSQPSKPLKHKKSGFMRMFNSGKDKDPDNTPPPLPIPTAADDTSMKNSASRVPVPSLPQISTEPFPSQDELSTNAHTEELDRGAPKRSPPNLYINTVRPTDPNRNQQQRTMTTLYPSDVPKPWADGGSQPRSAPADVNNFPSLKLRPVSGLFSSHFEHIVSDLQSTSSQSEIDTPITSPTGLYPISPLGERFSSLDVDVKPERIRDESATSPLAASQKRIGELERQVRSLKAELQDLQRQNQDGIYCSACGRGKRTACSPTHASSLSSTSSSSSGNSVVNRPRPKVGSGTSRFANGLS